MGAPQGGLEGNSVTALSQGAEMDLAVLQVESMELQVRIRFISPMWSLSEAKTKIWGSRRSEDIKVHQYWEVFPEVVLPKLRNQEQPCGIYRNTLHSFTWHITLSIHLDAIMCPLIGPWTLLRLFHWPEVPIKMISKLPVEVLLLLAHLSPLPQRS